MTDNNLSILSAQAAELPHLPGVYLMRAAGGDVLYVGKAKDLRARVRTYFAGGDGRSQIEFLLQKVTSFETIVTSSEEQAFLLERDLINKYKPRYNIRLKDDKSYVSIRLDESQEWPRLELVRRVPQDGACYFGPYTFSYEIRELLEIIQRVVPLRTCSDTVFRNRQRPCLEYQIKRCSGPCCLPVNREQYQGWVRQAVAIIEGRTQPLIRELKAEMEIASTELRFEDAALFRDRIAILQNVRNQQDYTAPTSGDRDIFGLFREERLAVLAVLQVRFGRIAGNTNFALSDVEVSDEAVLEAALGQYYEQHQEVPEEIVIPTSLEAAPFLRERLRALRGAAVQLTVPQRGVKLRLLNLAVLNAQQHYRTVFEAEHRYARVAEELAKLLGLKQTPQRIECIDISNLQGTNIVGALVVFDAGVPEKSAYKRYDLSGQNGQNDFAAVAEVVARRLRRGVEDHDLPDLLIIDGGPGQLSAALEAGNTISSGLEIVALAKERPIKGGSQQILSNKPERLYCPGRVEPIELAPDSEVSHFVARIRDEVHRFVITYHRERRDKGALRSVLDDLPGIGPARRQRLLRRFGSVNGMVGVGEEDLARAGRMPLALAKRLKELLN